MKNNTSEIYLITDLTFSGGSTFTTLEELKSLNENGTKVTIVHCPKKVNVNKPINPLFHVYENSIRVFNEIIQISADIVIIRHPIVISSPAFSQIAEKITAKHTVLVSNESMYSTNKKFSYSLKDFFVNVSQIVSNQKHIYPISNSIRKEFLDLPNFPKQLLSNFNWHPTFDASDFCFKPNLEIENPIRIGCHTRDAPEKWLDNKDEILAIYPASKQYRIRILGGARSVKSVLGSIPDNWEVIPFGAISANEYLDDLDVFIYFPHESRNEAFGRTIVEAMLSGIPCILPPRFKDNFGELALYAEPDQVEKIISRLMSNDEKRIHFLQSVCNICSDMFTNSSLTTRIEKLQHPIIESCTDTIHLDASAMHYKNWCESGQA